MDILGIFKTDKKSTSKGKWYSHHPSDIHDYLSRFETYNEFHYFVRANYGDKVIDSFYIWGLVKTVFPYMKKNHDTGEFYLISGDDVRQHTVDLFSMIINLNPALIIDCTNYKVSTTNGEVLYNKFSEKISHDKFYTFVENDLLAFAISSVESKISKIKAEQEQQQIINTINRLKVDTLILHN